MHPKMADLSLLEKESLYVPLTSLETATKNDQAQKVYAAYRATMYRQHGVWIQPFKDIVLDKNDKPIYFHASSYIPYLTNQGYKIKVVDGYHLVDYLRAIAEGSYVIVSVKDEGSQQITQEITAQLQELGLTQMDKSKLRYSFLWVARKKDESSYEVIHEACSTEQLTWEGMLGDTSVIVTSGGALSTNMSSIQVNGVEKSANQRGFNIFTHNSDMREQSITFDTFVTLYAESLFRAAPSKSMTNAYRTISRAGGTINGKSYTNCKEAFEQSYTYKRHRVFEADMELTSDGELVLRHDWDSYLYRHLQQQQPEGMQEGEALTLEQFTALKILNQYTPMRITDLFQFLVSHPDAIIITDTKYIDPTLVKRQFKRMVEAAAPFGYSVLLRVIPQLYKEEMYNVIEDIFPFPRYLYTLYQTNATDEQVVKFVKDKKIKFVAASPERYNNDLGKQLKKWGASVFIHTINDPDVVRKYVRNHVDGFYTDGLTAVEVEQEFLSYHVEMETRRNVLNDFLTIRYGIQEDEARSLLDRVSPGGFAVIGERIFQSQTVEDIYSILNVTKSP